jgi:Fe-S-cluster containining protein
MIEKMVSIGVLGEYNGGQVREVLIEVFRGGIMKKSICAECGGKCCKKYAGSVFPSDIKGEITEEAIRNLLKSGYAVDWFEGDPRKDKPPDEPDLDLAYFIRPAHKGITNIFDPSWGGECVFFTDSGCKLQFKDRPFECRALQPSNMGCKYPPHIIGKQTVAIEWLPYTAIFEKIKEDGI